jgi:ketosteroid isomerase-like protein
MANSESAILNPQSFSALADARASAFSLKGIEFASFCKFETSVLIQFTIYRFYQFKKAGEMKRKSGIVIMALAILLACFLGAAATASAQNGRERFSPASKGCEANSALTGVYRIDIAASDKLYSVIEGASSNVPFGEQQQFFIDLAVRLTPPDLLAIECRGSRVSLGSSRAPRVEFVADGVTRAVRSTDGDLVRSRIWIERNSLTFTSGGGTNDNLSFTFTPFENGSRLLVKRRISTKELIEPVVIQTVYTKISGVARWDIFDDAQVAKQGDKQNDGDKAPVIVPETRLTRIEGGKAAALRDALNEWIDATNARDIEKQMSFYMSQLKAFYLARNASRSSVRAEKNRVFAAAKSIDIRAEEPEIIFQDGGRMAIMRFRKKYSIRNGSQSRTGMVIQELRWQQTNGGWRIFSERDVKVIR